MTDAPTKQEIDEPTGNFLRVFELLASVSRTNRIGTAIVRQATKFDHGGCDHHAEPATVSRLSKQDCSHWSPRNEKLLA
jgi:hypothetical protein